MSPIAVDPRALLTSRIDAHIQDTSSSSSSPEDDLAVVRMIVELCGDGDKQRQPSIDESTIQRWTSWLNRRIHKSSAIIPWEMCLAGVVVVRRHYHRQINSASAGTNSSSCQQLLTKLASAVYEHFDTNPTPHALHALVEFIEYSVVISQDYQNRTWQRLVKCLPERWPAFAEYPLISDLTRRLLRRYKQPILPGLIEDLTANFAVVFRSFNDGGSNHAVTSTATSSMTTIQSAVNHSYATSWLLGTIAYQHSEFPLLQFSHFFNYFVGYLRMQSAKSQEVMDEFRWVRANAVPGLVLTLVDALTTMTAHSSGLLSTTIATDLDTLLVYALSKSQHHLLVESVYKFVTRCGHLSGGAVLTPKLWPRLTTQLESDLVSTTTSTQRTLLALQVINTNPSLIECGKLSRAVVDRFYGHFDGLTETVVNAWLNAVKQLVAHRPTTIDRPTLISLTRTIQHVLTSYPPSSPQCHECLVLIQRLMRPCVPVTVVTQHISLTTTAQSSQPTTVTTTTTDIPPTGVDTLMISTCIDGGDEDDDLVLVDEAPDEL